jgi:hypothetical protein
MRGVRVGGRIVHVRQHDHDDWRADHDNGGPDDDDRGADHDDGCAHDDDRRAHDDDRRPDHDDRRTHDDDRRPDHDDGSTDDDRRPDHLDDHDVDRQSEWCLRGRPLVTFRSILVMTTPRRCDRRGVVAFRGVMRVGNVLRIRGHPSHRCFTMR